MKSKIRVAVVFGGRSAEHEVSLQSALSIIAALDHDRYEIVPIGIDTRGKWRLLDPGKYVNESANPARIFLGKSVHELSLVPGKDRSKMLRGKESLPRIDVVFPVLHGTYGEDGSIQGLLRMLDVPFVGSSVLGSAVGMDKEVTKRLFTEAGLPTPKYIARHAGESLDEDEVRKVLGWPVFVKPANMGSSVGITKVHSAADLREAAARAFEYDRKILIEEAVAGRELECAVLGNDSPRASVVGEVVPQGHEFYSYDAKYLDENGAALVIPARLETHTSKRVRELAVSAFRVLCLSGMARVDFFLRKEEVLLSELNTIPGFTQISMYPKLWEATGVSYPELLDELIRLAIERHERESRLRTSYHAGDDVDPVRGHFSHGVDS